MNYKTLHYCQECKKRCYRVWKAKGLVLCYWCYSKKHFMFHAGSATLTIPKDLLLLKNTTEKEALTSSGTEKRKGL